MYELLTHNRTLMHCQKDLWGPDGQFSAFIVGLLLTDRLITVIFDPDHFINERLKYLTSNPFFSSFNAEYLTCFLP
ncbi:hypothetical protein PISMIDRAFT_687594 [Pisolithus microcarpus 441]|uniref:Uncharacterized protein n=1 Tax=Pisolithus microcarpus 441 TaxID=765257 RepID=A0A0C9YM71_9AGAM|nr:hypothetical protein BKA83DRAFT_687594 [Pisolithus microcarpus]KIK14969.1 hypothetical protein PISMIDRAFT_687594 [Pisolithus microcarpus 441]